VVAGPRLFAELGYVFAAAEGGHLEVPKFARQLRCPWDETKCNAIVRVRLEVLSAQVRVRTPPRVGTPFHA